MRKFTCHPDAKISGQTITAYLDNLQSFESRKVFEQYGIDDVDTSKWYRLQPLLNVLHELSVQPNATQNIVAIGMQIAISGVDPNAPEVPLPVVLEHWNDHMYANIQGAEVGTITAEKLGEKSYRITHRTVWPDNLVYGLAYGFARGRLPQGTHFTVWYENPDERLDQGDGDKTVICVKWD
jgi:hypothetical protein